MNVREEQKDQEALEIDEALEHAEEDGNGQFQAGTSSIRHTQSAHPLKREVDPTKYATGLKLIPEFNGKNWELFKRKLEIQFITMGIDSYLYHNPSLASDIEKRNDRIAYAEIVMRLSQVTFKQTAHCKSASQVWRKLCENYDEKKEAQASDKFIKFIEERKKPNESMKAYLDHLVETYHDLEVLDINIGEIALCAKALHGLPTEFSQAKAAARASEIKTISRLTNLLLSTEREQGRRLQITPSETAVLKAQKTKKHCTGCNKSGHEKAKCWVVDPSLKPKWLLAKEAKDKAASCSIEPTNGFNGFRITVANIEATKNYLIDSGANVSVTNDKSILSNYRKIDKQISVQACNGGKTKAVGEGTLTLPSTPPIKIDRVLYVPGITNTLISAHALTQQGLIIKIKDDLYIQDQEGHTLITAKMQNGLYHIKAERQAQLNETITLEQAHHRFGHASDERLKNIPKSTIGIKIIDKDRPFCDTCAQSKSRRRPFPEERRTKPTRPFEIISSDIKGPFAQPSPEGFRYYITFNCLYSTWTWVTLLKTKSSEEVFDAIQRYITDAQAETKNRATTLLTDGGGEYVNRLMSTYLLQKNIKHQKTVPYSPQQNGQAERRNLTIMQMARCTLLESGIGKEYWPFAVRYATHTLNRLPTKRIGWKTPYELWTNMVPEVEQMQRFGCIAWANIDITLRTSLSPTAEKCIFLGYPQYQKGYVVKRISDSTILVRRDITFNENTFIPNADDGEEPMEIIDEIPFEIYEAIDEYPTTYQDAMKSPQAKEWHQAAKEEMAAHNKNHTWCLVDPPQGTKPIRGRWVFTTKPSSEEKNKFKARFVAKGFSQRHGIDYEETFASVLAYTSLRVLLSIAAFKHWKVYQKDFTTAYLNAPLQEPIYMEQPEGFVKIGEESKVCLLKKALYGLKQAGRAWQTILFETIKSGGYKQSCKEPCIWYKPNGTLLTLIGIYVDDLLITGDDQQEITNISTMLATKFKLKDLGEAKQFLGMEISQTENGIGLTQSRYIRETVSRFRQEDCKSVTTPMATAYEPSEDEEVDTKYPIREAAGCLQFIASATRPDIAFAVNNISRHLTRPTKALWRATQKIVQYLKTTSEQGLLFDRKSLEIEAWSDISYAPDASDRKSLTGYIVTLGGNPIIWKSQKQPCVALSTTEAEYMATCPTAKEIVWLQDLLFELKLIENIPTTILNQDNQGAIFMENNDVIRQRSKHIDIRYHYIREKVKEKRIGIRFCPTEEMIADMLTKPLGEQAFFKHKNKMVMKIRA